MFLYFLLMNYVHEAQSQKNIQVELRIEFTILIFFSDKHCCSSWLIYFSYCGICVLQIHYIYALESI